MEWKRRGGLSQFNCDHGCTTEAAGLTIYRSNNTPTPPGCHHRYYRTIEGYRVLVQKDFVAFGTMCQKRSGCVTHPDQRSPVRVVVPPVRASLGSAGRVDGRCWVN
jgi:hypothetical protein